MRNVLGLVNLHRAPSLGSINLDRSIASTTFLGRYAFIDFPLSNFANSKIEKKGILVEKNIRSVLKHIGNGNIYNANTITGFTSIMYNEKCASLGQYNTDINNLIENVNYINQAHPDYILVAPVHIIYRMNYQDVIDAHIKSGADITMIYKKIDNGNEEENVILDDLQIENGKVKEIYRNMGQTKNINASLETYVMSRKVFDMLINKAKQLSNFFSIRDLTKFIINEINVQAYEYDGFMVTISGAQSYYNHSLKLLDPRELKQMFDPNWPIYTTTHNTPPSRYKKNAIVSNSFISNGSQINGKVSGSIISRDVIIEEGAEVIDSIVFTDTTIGKGVKVINAIIDKHVKVINSDVIGTKEKIMVVKEKDII